MAQLLKQLQTQLNKHTIASQAHGGKADDNDGIVEHTHMHSDMLSPLPNATKAPTISEPSMKEIHANVSDTIYNTIVRIVVHEAEFDFDLPFKIKGNKSASGTGFFIDDKGHILTCSHVVQRASHVYIEIPKEGKKQYKAHVLGICPHFDLALVKIEDYTNSQHCNLHEGNDLSIKPGDETYALGFPLGQDNLKVTKGIISGQQHNMYQIDTPINPGNSGGPLIKDNLVIGVNGAGVILANNIGYAVPISRYFSVKELLYMPKRLIHYPEIFGFEFQRTNKDFVDFLGYTCNYDEDNKPKSRKSSTSSTHKRRSSRLTSARESKRDSKRTTKQMGQPTMCGGGVYVKRTFKKSPVDGVHMRRGDIVCAMNGVSVDHFGEFSKRWMNQKMSMSNMLCSLPLNKKVEVKFWSEKTKTVHSKSFFLREYKMPIRRVFPEFEKIDYEVIGGMVVMPLTLNHCVFARGPIRKYLKIENRHEPKLIVASVLMGSSLAMSKTIAAKEILEEVNGEKVRTLDEFRKAITKTITKPNKKKYIQIITEDHNMSILSVDTLHKEESHLQSVYKYTPSALLKKL